MNQEMSAVEVDAATIYGARSEFVVEENGLAANTGHEVTVHPFAQAWRIQRVHVVEERPVRLKIVVNGFLIPESKFRIETAMALRQKLQRNAGVHPTLLGGRDEANSGGCVLR
jgi:hypothetical protein